MRAAGYTADAPLSLRDRELLVHGVLPRHVIPGINEVLPEVAVRYRNIDQQTYVDSLASGRFDSAIGIQWGPPGYAMDQWIFPWWHSRGGLNFNNVDDIELDLLLEQQRAETDAAERRALWLKVWERVHDQVYDVWWPEPHVRGVQHNYVMNMRWHGLAGSYVCFGSDQARSVWARRRRAGARPLVGERRQRPVVDALRLLAEADEGDVLRLRLCREVCGGLAQGDGGRALQREAVAAGADRGKGDRARAELACEGQRATVAARQQLVLAGVAAVPDRPHRVDHPARRQHVPVGRLRLARVATAERTAPLQQLRAGGPVDGAVHAAAAQQRAVGGVDDGVDALAVMSPSTTEMRPRMSAA